MKRNKSIDKKDIYRKYRNILGRPGLSDGELFKIHRFFMEVGRVIFDGLLERRRMKSRLITESGEESPKRKC
jgi:hypothetical protein